jgi:hypothetical protein
VSDPLSQDGDDISANRLNQPPSVSYAGPLLQGLWGLALWLSFGLLLEGLIGFRTPAYLLDNMRRDLFRLAHAHGTVFSIVLLISALLVERGLLHPPVIAVRLLQIGTVLMPVGFLLGGLWHIETDPNLFILLSPLGGLLIIFSVIAIAFSYRKR